MIMAGWCLVLSEGVAGSGPVMPGDCGSPGPAQTRHVVCMRIGGPARRRGIPDADIWHGVRSAIHKIDMAGDLRMLIGRPAMGHRWS